MAKVELFDKVTLGYMQKASQWDKRADFLYREACLAKGLREEVLMMAFRVAQSNSDHWLNKAAERVAGAI